MRSPAQRSCALIPSADAGRAEPSIRCCARRVAGPASAATRKTPPASSNASPSPVNILAEGDVTHLHIGFKGTMNALFLKDLADKTHRGLRGRVEGSKSAGGLCCGYRVVKTLSGGTVTTGEREIEPAEATIVERIFGEYVAGVAPKAIAMPFESGGWRRTGRRPARW